MSWIAAAVIGGSLISAYGSKSAADTQAGAASNATAAQLGMYNTTAANVAPWLQAGQASLKDLTAGVQPGGQFYQTPYTPFTMDQFHQDPGYQFQLAQGQNALENQMSKTGGANSNNLKGLINYTQGLASTDYQTALNNYIQQFLLGNQAKQQQFSNVAGIAAGGLSAGLQQGLISADVGKSIGSNIIGAGNAQAAGTVGVANALTGGISSGYNQWLQQQYLNQGGPTYGGNYISPTDLSGLSNTAASNIYSGAPGL